jgi:fucose 4-O-acetylase-like acetyltransferase
LAVLALYDVTETKVYDRLLTMDMFKGLAITGVIITHICLLQLGTTGGDGGSLVIQFMYSGLVMFMVVSGYFYKPGHSYWENVKKRVLPFLIVFVAAVVILTVVMYVYLLAIGYDLSSYSLIEVIGRNLISKGCFYDKDSYEYFHEGRVIMAPFEVTIQMYYLQILMVGYLIFYAIVDRVIGDWRKFAATILILLAITAVYDEFIHIQLPFVADLGPLVAVFLLVGAFLAKHDFVGRLETGYRKRKYRILFFVSIVFMLFCLFVLPIHPGLHESDFSDFGIFSVFVYFINSMACGMVIFLLSYLLALVPGINRIFLCLGRNTLPLFLLHMLVARMLVAPFVELDTTEWIPVPLPESLAVAVAAILVILAANYVYRRIKDRSNIE